MLKHDHMIIISILERQIYILIKMAAIIRDTRNAPTTSQNAIRGERKPILIDRIDDFQSEINAAIVLPKEDGVITVCDDKFGFVNLLKLMFFILLVLKIDSYLVKTGNRQILAECVSLCRQ